MAGQQQPPFVHQPLPAVNAPESVWVEHWPAQIALWRRAVYVKQPTKHKTVTTMKHIFSFDAELRQLLRNNHDIRMYWTDMAIRNGGVAHPRTGDILNIIVSPLRIPAALSSPSGGSASADNEQPSPPASHTTGNSASPSSSDVVMGSPSVNAIHFASPQTSDVVMRSPASATTDITMRTASSIGSDAAMHYSPEDRAYRDMGPAEAEVTTGIHLGAAQQSALGLQGMEMRDQDMNLA